MIKAKSKYTKTLNPKPELCADHKPNLLQILVMFHDPHVFGEEEIAQT
jgi:hypothetical protein